MQLTSEYYANAAPRGGSPAPAPASVAVRASGNVSQSASGSVDATADGAPVIWFLALAGVTFLLWAVG